MEKSLHIAMYPWLAFGHITPFLYLANKLARKGHKISFLVPKKTESKIKHFNRFPHLVTLVPITVPHVDGLPPGAEITADVAGPEIGLVATAIDRTEPEVETILRGLKPDVVFFDFAHWLPKLSRKLGFKTVYFNTGSLLSISYFSGYTESEQQPASVRLLEAPPGFPDPSIKLLRHEVSYFLAMSSKSFGEGGLSLGDRFRISSTECDVYAAKGCREIEGPFVNYLEKRIHHEIWLAGPILPEPPIGGDNAETLDPKWEQFLSRFEPGSVVYCSFGSEKRPSREQFQETVLGLELSGRPFLAALKPPIGAETVEEALPEGFAGRNREERGVVFGGWIQQHLILAHPAVGCFVSHCGYGSMIEGIVNGCQLVMVPNESDQFFNAKLIATRLRAGLEVERSEDDGSFTREGVCRAIQSVTSVGEIRANLANLRELLLRDGLESSYIDDFSLKLQDLVAK